MISIVVVSGGGKTAVAGRVVVVVVVGVAGDLSLLLDGPLDCLAVQGLVAVKPRQLEQRRKNYNGLQRRQLYQMSNLYI